MKITGYELCENALGEILGGELQFSVDALTRIINEEGKLIACVAKETAESFNKNVELLEYTNKTLEDLKQNLTHKFLNNKLYGWGDLKEADKKVEITTCENIAREIDKVLASFKECWKSLKKLNERVDEIKKNTNKDTTELELLIQYALKKLSKNFEDGLFTRVEKANNSLKNHIELSQKTNKR